MVGSDVEEFCSTDLISRMKLAIPSLWRRLFVVVGCYVTVLPCTEFGAGNRLECSICCHTIIWSDTENSTESLECSVYCHTMVWNAECATIDNFMCELETKKDKNYCYCNFTSYTFNPMYICLYIILFYSYTAVYAVSENWFKFIFT